MVYTLFVERNGKRLLNNVIKVEASLIAVTLLESFVVRYVIQRHTASTEIIDFDC